MIEVAAPVHVRDIDKLTPARSMEIADAQGRALLDLLRSLAPAEWDAVTDCDPWTVKDSAAHVLAWAEASISPREMVHQFVGAFGDRKEHGGVLLHAQNALQVRERAHLSPDEILDRLAGALPRFNKARRRLRYPMKLIPYRDTFSGDWITLGVITETTYTRDHFMHRLDILRAVGRPDDPVPSDATIVADVVREWAGRSKADVRLDLTGGAGGSYVAGTGTAGSVTGGAFDLMRRLAGRPGELTIEGDRERIEGWLRIPATF